MDKETVATKGRHKAKSNAIEETNSDFMARSIKRRQQAIADEMRQMQIDADHWNRTHPDENEG